jgi:hypothetical protein
MNGRRKTEDGRANDRDCRAVLHISPHLNLFGGVAEGRGWRLTIKICTFIDIVFNHVMRLEGANRVGGGAEGGKCPTLVPYIEAVAYTVQAWSG